MNTKTLSASVIRCLRCAQPIGPSCFFAPPMERIQPACATNILIRLESGVLLLVHQEQSIVAYCPSCAGEVRYCVICGCTDEVGCEEGCAWRERGPKDTVDVCSVCAGGESRLCSAIPGGW